jgi:hypothetical protein
MTDISTMSDHEREFHILLALCITEWATVENHLFCLLSLSLSATPQQVATLYYRTPNISSRLALTNEMLRTRLPKPAKRSGDLTNSLVEEWTCLHRRAEKGLPFRNHLAHWPKTQHTHVKANSKKITSVETWLEASMSLGELHRGKEDQQPIKIPDIRKHHKETRQLATDLHSFYNKLVSELLPKCS